MAKLWFDDHNGNWREIAEVQDFNDVFKEIHKFIDKCNVGRPKDQQFKIYYTRIFEQNEKTKIDVGSWSEFFWTDLKYENGQDDS